MAEIFNKIIIDPTNYISLLVLIIGLVSNYLKPFVKSQDFFEEDIGLILSEIKEKICKEYFSLLKTALDIDSLSSLRGTPSNTPDLINTYTALLFKSVERTLELKKVLRKVRTIYSFLFFSTIIGLIVLLFNSILKSIVEFNVYVTIILMISMILLIFGQIYGLFLLRRIEGKNKFFKEEILGSN